MSQKRLKLYHSKTNPLFFFDTEGAMPEVPTYRFMNLFSVIESNRWEFVSDIEEADVVPIHMNRWSREPQDQGRYHWFREFLKPEQVAIYMQLYNCDSFQTARFWRSEDLDPIRQSHDRLLIVHTNNHDDCIDPKYIFHDIMWNRQKYYMFDQIDEKTVLGKQYYWTGGMNKEVYSVGSINKILGAGSKKLLCLNRIYQYYNHFKKHREIRTRLRDTVKDFQDIYLSNPTEGKFFYPNGWDNNIANQQGFNPTQTSGKWYPVGDQYYNTSYVSVYVESSIESGDPSGTYCVSEKTFDPLVKGNFILPFSNPHFVKNIQQWYGFKMPDWINYSYDDIENTDDRMTAFLEEVKRIHSLSIEQLHEYYLRDKHILEHNRQVFINRPYDSLHDKVLNSITRLGWL